MLIRFWGHSMCFYLATNKHKGLAGTWWRKYGIGLLGSENNSLVDWMNSPQCWRSTQIYLSSISDLVGRIRRHPYNPVHHCLVAFVEALHRITHCFMYEEI